MSSRGRRQRVCAGLGLAAAALLVVLVAPALGVSEASGHPHPSRGGGSTIAAPAASPTPTPSEEAAGEPNVAPCGACAVGAKPSAGPRDLLLTNARLLDGTGAPPRERVSILIRDGRISSISQGVVVYTLAGTRTLDASGMTVLPGLIDTHVHFAAAPGGGIRGDSAETLRELNHHHLRAYLASGVTTVLDPGSFTDVARELQSWLAAGNSGPRFLTTGPVIRPPGGYGAEKYGSESTPAEVEAALDDIQALGGVGVKLAIERGFDPFGGLPQFSPEMRQAIIAGARQRNLPLYVHATTEAAQSEALDWGAHALMHSVMGGAWSGQLGSPSDVSDTFVEKLKASGAYQLTTFSLVDTWPGLYPQERLDEPLVGLTVPPLELATARDPQSPSVFATHLLGFIAPWLPESWRPTVGRWIWTRANLRAGVEYSQRNIRKLYEAGVPIVAATDAPSPWPEAIFNFHGPTTLREIALLGEAGLPPGEAIRAATATPAKMLGLEAEIGTVEVGKRGDLLVVRGDPLADLAALREVQWTIQGGVARTPEEWMKPADLSPGAGMR